MNWLRKLTSGKRGVVGLELTAGGFALAVRDERGQCGALAMYDENLHEGQSAAEYLASLVEQHELEGAACNLVLPAGQYQLLLVEAPDVPDEELRGAVRWRIKDLINISLEDAALDIFLLPDNAARSKRMLYVVVCEISYLKQCIELVSESGLKLRSIDIAELAIRNVSLLKDEGKSGSRGVAMIRIGSHTSNVSLYQEGNLYLSRSFQINYKGGLLDELPADSLMLEVQRSLDYYERQMGQRLPAALYMFGDNISEDKLTEDLQRGISGQVRVLDLRGDLQTASDLPEDLIAPCIAAIGASLRGEVQP